MSPFSSAIEADAESGAEVVVLRYVAEKEGEDDLEARIAPRFGGTLYSLAFGGEQLLAQPATLSALAQFRSGVPILFPTPNRVRDAVFSYEGRKFELEANNGKNAIHGLARRRPWKHDPPVLGPTAASVKVWLDWTEADAEFARFPFAHRLSVTYTMGRTGVLIAYAVDNRSGQRLPFGFGLHPWFRVPGDRKQVFLRVPAGRRMEAEDKLPTGKLLPVAGTRFDLRRPTALEGLDLDDVYIGLQPGASPVFELRDRGIRVTLGASREFTHVVVYTPPGQPFFCIENQTCSTDAHNLHARGRTAEAHLLVVEPGKTGRGAVDWKIDRPRARR